MYYTGIYYLLTSRDVAAFTLATLTQAFLTLEAKFYNML